MRLASEVLAPVALSLACAGTELWAVGELARGATDAAVWIVAVCGWAGLVLSALSGLALVPRR